MNILDQIIAHKQIEVAVAKKSMGLSELQDRAGFHRPTISLSTKLRQKSGIIAEFKRQSPSKGVINSTANPIEVAQGYAEAGASAISVLTDSHFFGGRGEDLIAIRSVVDIPLLRKDFIIDSYQLTEARSLGADIILLIAANLELSQCRELAEEARSLDLEVLLELHDESELAYVNPSVNMVGINNRNLKTFEVDIEHSIRMAEQLPATSVRIAESGLSDMENIIRLRNEGFHGFLIGEYFMKTDDPAKTCRSLIQAIS